MSRSTSKSASRKTSRARAFTAPGPLPIERAQLSEGVTLDVDVEAQRDQRLEALKAELFAQMTAGHGVKALDRMMARMAELERENERLAWRVLRANRYRFGRSTEKLSKEELAQLYRALGGEASDGAPPSDPSVPAPEPPEQVVGDGALDTPSGDKPDEAGAGKKKKKRTRVRAMKVAPNVERIVNNVALPPEECTCALCGRDKTIFDYVEHELYSYVPAKIVVHVERRAKASCEHCRKDVSVAPRQHVPAVERRVDASLLAKLVVDKTAMALPVDRQRRELARLGLDIPDKTLASYWAYVTDLIEPVATVTLADVFGHAIVGLDDSHLKTLAKGSKPGVFRGHLWCFVGTNGVPAGVERVGYEFTASWDATEIADSIAAIDGMMQCDGYAGYARELDEDEGDGESRIVVDPDRRLGCGMHIRSKFHAALLAKDVRAARAMTCFAELYTIEADCKARGLDAAARGEERRRRSWPILDALDAWVDDLHPKLLPKSALRRATTYARNQRAFFRRCFEDGRYEIDNGRVERRIRLFAVGRRNFLFTGSVRGGERLAVAYTLVDNCLLLGIDPHRYLVDVITKLEGGWPLARLSELVPWRWAAEHPAEHRAEQAQALGTG